MANERWRADRGIDGTPRILDMHESGLPAIATCKEYSKACRIADALNILDASKAKRSESHKHDPSETQTSKPGFEQIAEIDDAVNSFYNPSDILRMIAERIRETDGRLNRDDQSEILVCIELHFKLKEKKTDDRKKNVPRIGFAANHAMPRL